MNNNISFSTVGLAAYKDNEIDIEEHIESLIGKTVILQHEPENDDPHAIAVTLDGRKIGYVRKKDNDDKNIYGMMMGCYRHCRSARIVRRSEQYPTLITEADFSDVTPKKEKRKKVVTEWIVDKINPEPIEEWCELVNIMNAMLTLLFQGTATTDNMRPLLDRYKRLVITGFSKEFYEDRQELFDMLGKYKDNNVAIMQKEIVELSQHIHNKETRNMAFSFIKEIILRKITIQLKNSGVTISKNDVEKMISQMPSLFSSIPNDIDSLSNYIYYQRLPRKTLLHFFYTKVMYDMIIPNNSDRNIKKRTIRDFIIGPYKDEWIEFIGTNIEGKTPSIVGCIMRAFVDCGVLYEAQYKLVVNTYWNFGNDDSYRDGFNHFAEKNYHPHYIYMCDIINNNKKKLMQEK